MLTSIVVIIPLRVCGFVQLDCFDYEHHLSHSFAELNRLVQDLIIDEYVSLLSILYMIQKVSVNRSSKL